MLLSYHKQEGMCAEQWVDTAYILGVSPLNERDALVEVLTREHGKVRAVVKYGATSKQRGLLHAGNHIQMEWRARLATHMGQMTVEVERCYLPAIVNDAPRLLMLQSAHALCRACLYEQDASLIAFNALSRFQTALLQQPLEISAKAYALFELSLLAACGYGLDLTTCAATGVCEGLTYVSPKSGHAVSQAAGAPYHDRLFRLPRFFLDDQAHPSPEDIQHGLAITSYFLQQRVLEPPKALPPAHGRMRATLARQFAPSMAE
jgi:DNA repair protein RecO (recombination protein O)